MSRGGASAAFATAIAVASVLLASAAPVAHAGCGGVVAYKDITHLTPTFSGTLGPYLLAQVRDAAASW